MNKIIWFASANKNKVLELKKYFYPYGYLVKSLLDLNESLNIVENGSCYQENALIKVKALAQYLNKNHISTNEDIIIADDTGLEIEALDNFPGIFSERWKGDMSFYQAMQVILKKMINKVNRKAIMITALVYFDSKNKITKTFIGRLEGEIAKEIKVKQGFGYDPFFYLPNKGLTLSEISQEEKNKISHRGQALNQLIDYLKLNELK